MAINYPGSLDDFTNPAAGNTLDSPSHSGQHSDLNDAVEALEAKVGIGASPAGSATAGQVLTAQGGGTAIWETPNEVGLTLLNSTDFSSVTSQTINDVFSATYDNYLLFLKFTAMATGSTAIGLQFTVAGTPTTSNYKSRTIRAYTSPIEFASDFLGTDEITIALVSNTNPTWAHSVVNIISPFLSIATTISANETGSFGASNFYIENNVGVQTDSTSFDGIKLNFTNSASGTIRIYGVKN